MLRNALKRTKDVVSQLSRVRENIKTLPILALLFLIVVLSAIWLAQSILGIHSSEDTTSNMHFEIRLPSSNEKNWRTASENFQLMSPEDAEVFVWYLWSCGQSSNSDLSDAGLEYLIVYVDRNDTHRNFKGWKGHFRLEHSYFSIETQKPTGRRFRKYELIFEITRKERNDSDKNAEKEVNNIANEISCRFDVEVVSHQITVTNKLIGIIPSLVRKIF